MFQSMETQTFQQTVHFSLAFRCLEYLHQLRRLSWSRWWNLKPICECISDQNRRCREQIRAHLRIVPLFKAKQCVVVSVALVAPVRNRFEPLFHEERCIRETCVAMNTNICRGCNCHCPIIQWRTTALSRLFEQWRLLRCFSLFVVERRRFVLPRPFAHSLSKSPTIENRESLVRKFARNSHWTNTCKRCKR